MSIKVITITLCMLVPFGLARAWFDPYPTPEAPSQYGKVIITRANTFETYPKDDPRVFSTNSSALDVDFFDAGDLDEDITVQYGGNSSDTFACAWPVTFYVWFQTNTLSVHEGGGYKTAKLQYFKGTNSESSVAWNTIYTVTNFNTMNGIEGAHFGLITWYPPETNNVHYLIRVWAELQNGMQNALLDSTDIDKDGTVDNTDWNDYEVLLIKTIRYKKPGARSLETSFLEEKSNVAKFPRSTSRWWGPLWRWFRGIINYVF